MSSIPPFVSRGLAPAHRRLLAAHSSGAGYVGPPAQALRAAGPGTLAERVARAMSGDWAIDASTRGGRVSETERELGRLPDPERQLLRRSSGRTDR